MNLKLAISNLRLVTLALLAGCAVYSATIYRGHSDNDGILHPALNRQNPLKIENFTKGLEVIDVTIFEINGIPHISVILKNNYAQHVTGYQIDFGTRQFKKDSWLSRSPEDKFGPGDTNTHIMAVDDITSDSLRVSVAILNDTDYDGDETAAIEFFDKRAGAWLQIKNCVPLLDTFIERISTRSGRDRSTLLELQRQIDSLSEESENHWVKLGLREVKQRVLHELQVFEHASREAEGQVPVTELEELSKRFANRLTGFRDHLESKVKVRQQ